jgi:hypothetical protein
VGEHVGAGKAGLPPLDRSRDEDVELRDAPRLDEVDEGGRLLCDPLQ